MEPPVHRVTMEFELAPAISVSTGTFCAMIAPEELVLPALANPDNVRYLFLYLAGNSSGILPAVTRRPSNMEFRRAVSAGHLATEIRAARHSILFVEHDRSLYESMNEALSVAHALKAASEGSVVVLYTPKTDNWFDVIMARADQVYFFREPPLPPRNVPRRVHHPRKQPCAVDGQATLDGFFGGGP